MTEQELQKGIADDLKAVLEEARSMGCTEVKAFHHIPLKNVAVVVDALEKQIAKKPENVCHELGLFDCPVCHRRQVILYQGYYCKECGQRLDWEDSEV